MNKIISLIVVFIFCLSANGQKNGTIKGVVTYRFNETIGTKPDVGATVLMHRKFDTLHDVLKKHRSNEVLLRSYKLLGNSIKSTPLFDKMNKAEDDYKATKLLADKYIYEVGKDASTIKITVDGSGNYSHTLPEGEYEIIVISKNNIMRNQNDRVKIVKDETVVSDFDFGRI